jgi:fructose-bisphosphate aldolase class II
MLSISEIIKQARFMGVMIPAFNVPYLPMVEPVVQAIVDQDAFSLVETARLEWIKFEAHRPAAVAEEFGKWQKPEYVRLHLDHVPAIDEDKVRVDFLPIFEEALSLGYESVMIDGSRLALEQNIQATRQVVELAHAKNVPVEAELGAVLGHEVGVLPPYEELFKSGRGFTSVEEARIFAERTQCDWLSVAVGNVHGAIAAGQKDEKKVAARLDLERLDQLYQATKIPLVLHGGSGIQQAYILEAMKRGITKINVGTEIRQPYEVILKETSSILKAQQAVYDRTTWIIRDFLKIHGLHTRLSS